MRDWDITSDDQRRDRIGLDEAIFCPNKSVDQLCRLLADAQGKHTLLLTRLDAGKAELVAAEFGRQLNYDPVSRTAYFGEVTEVTEVNTACACAVVSAGSSDVPVAREAVRTLGYYGHASKEIYDVGVAGLWRLLERIDEIESAAVVIAVAGMDGVLPGIIAGLVPGLVIAVPVSHGYGVAADGKAALSTALSSCAPGLVVVNIDNGYGAACAALRTLNTQ